MVWLEGLNPAVRTVKKVYSVETEILQAFWCRFRSKNSDKDRGRRSTPHGDIDGGDSGREKTERDVDSRGLVCICVREQSCLTLFLQTGAVHYVPLPFPVSSPLC